MAKTHEMMQNEKDKKVIAFSAKQKELQELEADLSELIKEKQTEAHRVEASLAGKYKRYLAEHPIDRTQEAEIERFITSKAGELALSSKNYEKACKSAVASMQRISAPSIRSPLLTPYKETLRSAVKLHVGELKQLLDEVLSATNRFYKNGISKENMDKLRRLMGNIWIEGNDISISINSFIIAKGSIPSRYGEKIERWKMVKVPEDIEATDNQRIAETAYCAKSRLDAAKSEISTLESSLNDIETDLVQETNLGIKLNAELVKMKNSYQTDRDEIIEKTISRLQMLDEANNELQTTGIALSDDLDAMRLDLDNTLFLHVRRRNALKALIADTEDALAGVQTKMQALHTTLDSEKNNFHAQLDSLDQIISDLENQLTKTDSKITSLENSRVDTKRKIAALSQQLPVLQRAVDDAREDYLIQTYGDKKVLSRIEAKQKKIEDVSNSVNDLEMDIEKIDLQLKTSREDISHQSRITNIFKKSKPPKTISRQEVDPNVDERINQIDAFHLIESTLVAKTISSEETTSKRLPSWGKPAIAVAAVLCVLQSLVVIHFLKGDANQAQPPQVQSVEDSSSLAFQEDLLAESDSNVSDYESWLKEGSSEQTSEQAEETADTESQQSRSSDNTIEYTWPDGISYIGGYKDGQANGYGEMTFPDEGIYKGNFEDGMRSGFGTFSWGNGDSYSGNWKADAMDGQGTYTFADGYTMEGTWSANQFIGNASGNIMPLEEQIEQIELNYGDYVLELNDSVTLEVTISPEAATYQSLTWASSDPSVANVTSNGVVTAYSIGETMISVTSDNGVTASCYINVYQEITSIWDGNWSIAATDSYGSYEGTNYGTCIISTDSMTVTVDGGSSIALTANGESTLTGTTTSGAYTGELCYTSLTEYQILLELNWVYTAIGYDDVVTTYYFLLTRMEG